MTRSAAAELQAMKARNTRLVSLLDRLFAAAEADPTVTAEHSGAETRAALDNAVSLLDHAVSEAERHSARADRLETLLARALDNLESLEHEHSALREELARREAAIEEVLALSERGLQAAASQNEALSRGFWQRFLGRGAPLARTPTTEER